VTDLGRAALSVDAELFRHTPAYRGASGHLDDPTVGLDGIDALRTAFDAHDAEATWFVVGELADEVPDEIRPLAAAGHEIASHTHTHRLLSELAPEERRTELVQSRRTLEDVTGSSVSGIRVPAFDLPDGIFGAFGDAGYAYDSSVVPCRRVPGWYGGEYDTDRPSPATAVDPDAPADVVEVPVGVSPVVRLPVGGAWMRLLGRRYTLWAVRRLAESGAVPVLYVHPWELVDLPDVAGVPRRVTWRTGAWTRRTVKAILSLPLEFVTVGELAESVETP
jgi:peptidoglycan/xylan/chitin deacetylase (PgdA/CDA1 family)